MIDDDMPLARFAITFNGASYTDPNSIALMVMQSILGCWNKNYGGGKHMCLYRGKVGLDAAKALHLMEGLDWKCAIKNIEASVNWLKANGSQKKETHEFDRSSA